jgi:hypothetical protein
MGLQGGTTLMAIDRYTKVVLTVIALALVVLVGENAVRPVSAQSALQKVAICDERTNKCASVGQDPAGLVVYSRN